MTPDLVLGHCVGEVAAAEASGAIELAEAVRLFSRGANIRKPPMAWAAWLSQVNRRHAAAG